VTTETAKRQIITVLVVQRLSHVVAARSTHKATGKTAQEASHHNKLYEYPVHNDKQKKCARRIDMMTHNGSA